MIFVMAERPPAKLSREMGQITEAREGRGAGSADECRCHLHSDDEVGGEVLLAQFQLKSLGVSVSVPWCKCCFVRVWSPIHGDYPANPINHLMADVLPSLLLLAAILHLLPCLVQII